MTPASSFSFVVNPRAGRGAGYNLIPWLEAELKRVNIRGEILLTTEKGHAKELAGNASGEIVVAVGGDGTINEVVNGLDLSEKVLGIIPCGSGNDLIKSLGIPNSAPRAFHIVVGNNRREIDVGCISANSGSRGPKMSLERLFVNGVGIGFDAAVAERTAHIKYVRGFAVYLVAVLQTLGKYRAPFFHLDLDGEQISAKYLLIAIGNGACAGGGFYLTPSAMIDDGKLDVCVIEEKSIQGILRIMPKVMKGLHDQADGAQFYSIHSVGVQSDQGFFLHADGEVIGGGSLGSARIEVNPRRMTIACP